MNSTLIAVYETVWNVMKSFFDPVSRHYTEATGGLFPFELGISCLSSYVSRFLCIYDLYTSIYLSIYLSLSNTDITISCYGFLWWY
jgi:hypothetical protein